MNKINPTFLITFLLLYFGACGGLWHIGYWSTFDINFLQYINLTDIIKSFVYPFAASSGTALVLYISTTLANYHDRLDNPESLIFGKGSNTKTGIFLNKYVVLIVSLYILALSNFAIFGGNIKWSLIPFLVAVPLSVYLTNRNLVFNFIINPDLRSWAIIFMLVLPLMSFCFAKKQSIEIFENKSFKKITEIQPDNDKKYNILLGLKYLGATTDKAFLTDSINSEITILNTSNLNYIKYKTVSNNSKRK